MGQILAVVLAMMLSVGTAGAQDKPATEEDKLVILQAVAEAGMPAAQHDLGMLYANGDGVQQDFAEAARLWRLAADQGYIPAQLTLGTLYHNGDGVSQDYTEAARLYRLAADRGYSSAQYNLAGLYYKGEGVPQDYAEAARLYRLTADQGVAEAQFKLGFMYYKGEGVTQDYATAHMRFNLGCALDIQVSCENRDKLSITMLPEDISDAQRRARVCLESNYKDCN